MNHNLIMENWRTFLHEVEKSGTLDEGMMDKLRALGFGLALMGTAVAPISQAQAAPWAETTVGERELPAAKVKAIQKVLSAEFQQLAKEHSTDPAVHTIYKKMADTLNKKLGSTLGMPGKQFIGAKETYGFDADNPNSPASQNAIQDAELVQQAMQIAINKGHLSPQALAAAESVEKELTPTQKGHEARRAFRQNQRRQAKNITPAQQAKNAAYMQKYQQNKARGGNK